ncbi:trimethylguanosine synthase-like [Harmonia axyridis]|nr:trimethylguanosine synthase-like [Harmonia axyridis]XP_045480260.1 trimethylguanosine synthase-like [Harmonia axyridis]
MTEFQGDSKKPKSRKTATKQNEQTTEFQGDSKKPKSRKTVTKQTEQTKETQSDSKKTKSRKTNIKKNKKTEETQCDSQIPNSRNLIDVYSEIKTNPELKRYWHKRFQLFSRFNHGIQLDEESWYSVTPESIAKKTAEICRTNVIVDGFCGAGGNSIQFALTCKKVIAVDIDPKKIELAKNNAAIYGVSEKIKFIVGDIIKLAPMLKADAVFLSPPWGGPSYLKERVYDLEKTLKPVPFSTLINACMNISPNIAVYLPKNVDTYDMGQYLGRHLNIEMEENVLCDKIKAKTFYYNGLAEKYKMYINK